MKIVKIVIGFVFGLAVACAGVFALLWLNAGYPNRPTQELAWAIGHGNTAEVKAHLFWDNLFRSTVDDPLERAYFPRTVKADPNSFRGATLLHVAVLNEDTATIDLLLARGANINSLGANYGQSPLHLIIARHREPKVATGPAGMSQTKPAPPSTLQMAEYLITKGADVNLKNAKGQTPMDLAKAAKAPLMIECLKRHGAK